MSDWLVSVVEGDSGGCFLFVDRHQPQKTHVCSSGRDGVCVVSMTEIYERRSAWVPSFSKGRHVAEKDVEKGKRKLS